MKKKSIVLFVVNIKNLKIVKHHIFLKKKQLLFLLFVVSAATKIKNI